MARALPDETKDKQRLCSDTEALALRNEKLKRTLEAKRDALDGAMEAQVCVTLPPT